MASKVDHPDQKLAAAILKLAMQDARPADRARMDAKWQEDAWEWFFSQESRAGSFHWVCSVLRVKPVAVRHWLLVRHLDRRKTPE